jgi:hypothetical protein
VTEQRDIVERLDALNKLYWEDCRMPYSEAGDVFEEAAAEITKLRKQLVAALDGLVELMVGQPDGMSVYEYVCPLIGRIAKMDQTGGRDE